MITKLRHYILTKEHTLKPNLNTVSKSLRLLMGVLLFQSVHAQLHIGTDVHIADGGNLHVAVAETIFEQ